MNFSSEEIYQMFGQYDKFVSITFQYGSEAINKYKPSLMGTFKYTLEERQQLAETISKQNNQRTNGHVKFIPSDLDVLTDSQRTELDKNGFQSGDIFEISSFREPLQNRFDIKGKKEIQNVIKVSFDPSGTSLQRLELYNLTSRLKAGYKLFSDEENKYWGYKLFFNADQVSKDDLKKLIDPLTGKVKEEIRFYQLKAEYFNTEYTDTPKINDELSNLLKKRSKANIDLLKEDLKRSSERLTEIGKKYNDNLRVIIKYCLEFEDEVLLPYELPIWWDFERFLHIYIRHVKETKIGERFEDKTVFQYKFRDIKRIISGVLRSIYKEILQHFKDNPTNTFKRLGKRSVYHDGNYYRVEIEPSGRLVTFHPYNDNETRPIDEKPTQKQSQKSAIANALNAS